MENIKSSPKDVFMHLLAIGTLYLSVAGFVTLLFQYIDLYFLDPLTYESYRWFSGPMRWGMASVIILFPAHLLLLWAIRRDLDAHPEYRELRIRKWLVYFTLFVTAIAILSDLVTLVYNFLGGELTARFTLKMLVVLMVAAWVFWYYLNDLRNTWSKKALHVMAWVTSAVVLAAVIGGFFTAGSPFKTRLIRFDEQRISDLQTLQWQIISYWQSKGRIPAKLADLEDSISGFRVPLDPLTRAAYEYHPVIGQAEPGNTLRFELCADFSLPTSPTTAGRDVKFAPGDGPYGSAYSANWDHAIGRVCFARVIDPELYPKFEKGPPRP